MACEKNNTTIDNGTTNGNGDNTAIERVIIYTVGGNENRRTLATESEWWTGYATRLTAAAKSPSAT